MLYGTTKVNVIDFEDSGNRYGSIEDLWQLLSPHANYCGDNAVIDMKKLNLYMKIQDWFGWSDIHQIERTCFHTEHHSDSWREVICGGSVLIAHKDMLLPVYDVDSRSSGFNGEALYKTTIKSINELNNSEMIRLRRGIVNGVETEFATPEVNNKYLPINDNYGYNIITRSKKYNAGNFYVSSMKNKIDI